MPLVVITGIPLSGKTTRAEELKTLLGLKVSNEISIINEESLGITREQYAFPLEEKKIRQMILSRVERDLSKEKVIIVDSMNYIKGFRYQLYCIARAMGTSSILFHILTPNHLAREWNSEKTSKYSNFDELLSRYEEPGDQKWDKPYFPLMFDSQIDLEGMYSSLFERKIAPPNQSTVVKPTTSSDYLTFLNTITQKIVDKIVECQKNRSVLKYNTVILNFKREYSLAEMRRFRQQFIQLNKQITQDVSLIESSFLSYLNQLK